MALVHDTSAVIAVIINEPHKTRLIKITKGVDLIAPVSLYAEIGNAFSAMFKRKRITMEQALQAIAAFQRIPIRYIEIDLEGSVELAMTLDVYAYDAYMINCAMKNRCPLLSLDDGLRAAAKRAGVQTLEVAP